MKLPIMFAIAASPAIFLLALGAFSPSAQTQAYASGHQAVVAANTIGATANPN